MLNWLFLVWLPRKLNQNKKKKNSLFVLSLFRNVKLNYCAMLNWFIGAEQKNGGQRGHKFPFCFPGVSQQPNKWNLNSQAQTLQENIANWHLQVDYSPKLVEYPYAWEILASINKSSVSSKINPNLSPSRIPRSKTASYLWHGSEYEQNRIVVGSVYSWWKEKALPFWSLF